MRAARLCALLPLLGACAMQPAPTGTLPARAEEPVTERAAIIGGHMRAALACDIPVPAGAQDRAALIEATALDRLQRSGGAAARDAFLHAMQPPRFDPRRQGRDRRAWCARQRPDIRRVAAWLGSEEGAAFVRRAEEARR